MSFDKCPRFKDPFSTSPLPKSFYYPTPSRDVDTNVVIQSLEKKDELFKTGSTFQLAALPQLKNVTLRNQVSRNNVTNSEDGYNETWPKSEQPSNSALMDTSQLTSSLDEAERDDFVGSFLHQLGNKSEKSCAQDESTSVIQKYINRFRYSAPRSREERVKETSSKNTTFWWLNSDTSTPEVTKPSRTESLQPSSNIHELKNGMKLTREAVLELDKETLDLQQKADTLLSKSQLSLVSSGPCVSTDGLGSSSALSECSYGTDPQPAYRPIFVNLQGELQLPAPKNDYHGIEEKHSNPNDVLARWRMRKKMEDAQQKSTHVTTKVRPVRNHNEIDIRLEEFRKKLFAQRALITTEDIQFERQRMKILIDDEDDEKQQKVELQLDKKDLPSSTLPTEDAILSRLRQITRTEVQSHHGNSTRNNQDAIDSTQHGFHSSNVYTTHQELNRVIQISHNDHATLNTNNTALDQGDSGNLRNAGNYCVDDMKSFSICDAKQKAFSLKSSLSPTGDVVRADVHRNSPENILKDQLEHSQSQTESIDIERNQHQLLSDEEKHYLSENAILCDSEFVPEQSVPYHQRLQAEKPCDDSSGVNKERMREEYHIKGDDGSRSMSHRKKKSTVSKSCEHKFESSDSSKYCKGKKEFPQKRRKSNDKEGGSEMYVNSSELNDVSSENSRLSKNHLRKSYDCSNDVTKTSQTKQKSSTENKHRYPEETDFGSGTRRHLQLSQQSKIQKVIGETVVDHIFDGPSMISSVDSWASLFPKSPMQSHSFHNSTTVTPSKDVSSCDQITSTPQKDDMVVSQENDDSYHESNDEFTDDPLMNLLQQQKKEYIRKLELIELKLQQLDMT